MAPLLTAAVHSGKARDRKAFFLDMRPAGAVTEISKRISGEKNTVVFVEEESQMALKIFGWNEPSEQKKSGSDDDRYLKRTCLRFGRYRTCGKTCGRCHRAKDSRVRRVETLL